MVPLPAEIWQEIFQHSAEFRDPLDRMKIVLTLVSVCATWRAIALQMPTLWNNIVLQHTVTRVANERAGEYKLVKMFLDNSRQSQLNIYIQLVTSNRDKASTSSACCSSTRCDARSSVFGLASLLAPHASRFRRFHILSTRYSPVRQLLSTFPQIAMPRLQELHIDRVQTSYSKLHFDCPRTCPESLAFLNMDHLASQTPFHDNFPALKSVALSFVPLLLPGFTPRHLTSLKMTLPHLDFTGELRNLLMANSHSLERLCFMFTCALNPLQDRWIIPIVAPEELVHFPNVKQLSISFIDPDMLLPLMAFLRFPGVTSLRITSIPRDQRHSTRNLFSCLYECMSFANIEELSLENIFIGNSPPVEAPGPIPHPYNILTFATLVRSLTLANFDPRVLSYLSSLSKLGNAAPLGCLSHLHLIPAGGRPQDCDMIVRFLQEKALSVNDSLLSELKITAPSSWTHDLTSVDVDRIAQRIVLSTPHQRIFSGGIWDDDY